MSVTVPSLELMVQHDVAVDSDRVWQRRLRLSQALWREAQGLAAGVHPRGRDEARTLGSRLAMPEAERDLSNYLTETIRQVVREELSSEARRDEQKLYSAPRIYDDLLSSQPLCFNLFGELKADLTAASAVGRHLWPDRVRDVTRIDFEHSPGRGDAAYLGNRTAFDVYLEHTVPGGGEGFIAIEVKYHENMSVGAAANRERTEQIAKRSGIFANPSMDELRSPPLQQVWFDHLLALSMLDADAERWAGNGLFVFLHPVANEAAYRIVNAYQRHLLDGRTFQRLTLEELTAVLQLKVGAPWVEAFETRYLIDDQSGSDG